MFAWFFVVFIGKSFKDGMAEKTLAKGTGRSTFIIVGGLVEQLCRSDLMRMLGPEIRFPQARVTTQILQPEKLELPTGVEEFMKDSVSV